MVFARSGNFFALSRKLLLSALIATAAALAVADDTPISVRVVFSETANLTYQLDMVSGAAAGADGADYRHLWDTQFLNTDEDRALLERWGQLKHKYAHTVYLSNEDMPLYRSFALMKPSNQLFAGGLRSESEDQFAAAADAVMLPPDALQLEEVVRHFSLPFHTWWQRAVSDAGRALVQKVNGLLSQKATLDRMDRYRQFYAPSLPARSNAVFSLVYHPDYRSQGEAADLRSQQVGNVAAIQFMDGDTAEDRAATMIHEFCHFLYRSRSDVRNAALQKSFVDEKDECAMPAFNLMNETLATALGNGLAQREFTPPDAWKELVAKEGSFYSDPCLDCTGKAAMEWLDAWMKDGKTLDDAEFAPGFTSLMHNKLGASLERPSLFLKEAFFFIDAGFDPRLMPILCEHLGEANAYRNYDLVLDRSSLEDYQIQPGISAVFVVPPAQLDALVQLHVLDGLDALRIRNELKEHESVLYAWKRNNRSATAYKYVIVTTKSEDAKRRILQLAAEAANVEGIVPDAPAQTAATATGS